MSSNENVTFSFSPETHTYYLNRKPIPCVTQLTDIFSTINIQEDSDLELAMESAAERGTVMHSYLEHQLSGGERDDFELPSGYLGYADGVDLFLSEHRLIPALVETPIWGELDGIRYAGTPDCVGTLNGVLSILDWKFVSQVQKTKVGAQLNAYRCLCEYNSIFADRLYCVQFLKDGTYRLYPTERSDVFRLCLQVYQETHKKHPRGRIA